MALYDTVTGNEAAIALPGTTGDLLILHATSDDGPFFDPTRPSGWTKCDSKRYGSACGQGLYYRVKEAGDTTVTLSGDGTVTNTITVAALAGTFDPEFPIYGTSYGYAGSATTVRPEPIVVPRDSIPILFYVRDPGATWTPPAGYTELYDRQGGMACYGSTVAELTRHQPANATQSGASAAIGVMGLYINELPAVIPSGVRIANISTVIGRHDTNTGTSIRASLPFGMEVDDELIAVVAHPSASNFNAAPAGWTNKAELDTLSTSVASVAVFTKLVETADLLDADGVQSFGWASGNEYAVTHMLLIKDHEGGGGDPIEAIGTVVTPDDAASIVLPSVDVDTRALLVGIICSRRDADLDTLTPPGSMTLVAHAGESTFDPQIAIGEELLTVDGSTGTRTWTPSVADDSHAGILLAIMGAPAIDTTPPEVIITDPTFLPPNPPTIVGTITVTASATDDIGVDRVTLLIDGSPLGIDFTAPYEFELNSTNYSNGEHTLTAIAYDAQGNSDTDELVILINNVAPVESLDPSPYVIASHTRTSDYAGVVVNQNQAPASATDYYNLNNWAYQEFKLPDNYARGVDDEAKIPELAGFQVLCRVPDGESQTVTMDYTLSWHNGVTWIELAADTATGAPSDGERIWMNIFLKDPISVTEEMLTANFRFGIDSDDINRVWYSAPNPLRALSLGARAANGTTALTRTSDSEPFSFCFRVLSMVADSGVDFLGNQYRAVVVSSTVDNISTLAASDKFWESPPLPSRFAVVSQYFDLSNDTDPAIVDNIIVDPITPNVHFNVYYSNEGDPADNEADWENKLWTRVPQHFVATKRESHKLGTPISARYIKIEYTHLQAKSYRPSSDFSRAARYKKYPKWVLDYFLARVEQQNLRSGRVGVIYDALDLAYNYYLGDLTQNSDDPIEIDPNFVEEAPLGADTLADQMDPIMLQKINLAMQPYVDHPAIFAKPDTLLGEYVRQVADSTDYPAERPFVTQPTFDDIAASNNQEVAFENNYPIMYFHLTCRHKYREVYAEFDHDRAYFVGVREVAFLRERYDVPHDTVQYVETTGDMYNTELSDFRREGDRLVAS
jgi:hypothetical protein